MDGEGGAMDDLFGFSKIAVGAGEMEQEFEVIGNCIEAAGDAEGMIGGLRVGVFGGGEIFVEHGLAVLDFMLFEFGGTTARSVRGISKISIKAYSVIW